MLDRPRKEKNESEYIGPVNENSLGPRRRDQSVTSLDHRTDHCADPHHDDYDAHLHHDARSHY